MPDQARRDWLMPVGDGLTPSSSRMPVRFLVFAASLRHGSLNTSLAALAADTIEANGGEDDVATMAEFDDV